MDQDLSDSPMPAVPVAEQSPPTADRTGEHQERLDRALDMCNASQDFWQKGELDSAIDTLDQAYDLILRVNTPDCPKTTQQKEDIRFMISKRILEIYASRSTAAVGLHDEIPLTINKHVEKEIRRFTGPERAFFERSLRRSGKYRTFILSELKAAGLPEELSWLPLIESGFKVNALSKARALGLWQFIPSTGYKFGLKRNLFVDERLDPEKSTRAAIAYLKELHGIFGDWSTVLAAYNCGEGRVLRTIRKQNVNYLDNFWDLYGMLPRETSRYVPRFLATLHIIANAEKYGFDLAAIDAPKPSEAVTITRQVHLKDAARAIGISEKSLKGLNPELRYNLIPEGNYQLNVPPEKSALLLASIDSLKTSSAPRRAFLYHRVRRGETLSTIAKRYRTSVSRIARVNKVGKKNIIVAGKMLKIPQKGVSFLPGGKKTKITYGQAKKHVVRKGDSLWNVARHNGTTTNEIKVLNGLSTADLRIGQVLKLPNGSGKTKARKTIVYRVQAGDSPFTIAQRHNIDLERFLSLNRLTSSSKIFPGQKLYIK